MAKLHHDADSKILSITQLPNGRLFLATERRLYEYIDGVWMPMQFSEPPAPEPAHDEAKGKK